MTEDQFMGNIYQRFPVTIERGLGSHVWDINGKEYIDCMGGYGVAIVGHCNPRVVHKIKEQLDKIITVHSSLYNKTREEFLERLAKIAPSGLNQVFLNNSGTEAVEAAIKFARKFTGKKGLVAMNGSYHGKSYGSLSVTFNPKYRKAFEPLLSNVSFSPFGDIEALKSTINQDTALIILEPIQGESGIHVAPDGFLQEVRKICNENGIVLVFDEIQSGMGRTGKMWASQHWETVPDIMCLAKGIAGGVPMGATLVKPEILACIGKGEQSSTFGGNPLSCAAGIGTIQALTEDGLVENGAKMGKVFREGLERLKEKHKIIREVRGKGLMIGIEMKFEVKDILFDAMANNLLLLYSGKNILRLLPPLVISEPDITKALETLDIIITKEKQRRNV
ncbi:MAG TPA: acetylornithine/succinylornithine family transaminase [Candidatus Bathyarchaeia archaeon]|nr:acetylornithine/succinylornithine family transaminase [Candidatus Bathyarchaeia archaeon]